MFGKILLQWLLVYLLLCNSVLFIQTATYCLHIFPSYWDKKVLGPSEISVLQRSQPDVFQILNVYGKTLLLNLFNVNEFWLYDYKLQESLRCDKWLWLFKIYLHRVRYSKIIVLNSIEITQIYCILLSAGTYTRGVQWSVKWQIPSHLKRWWLLHMSRVHYLVYNGSYSVQETTLSDSPPKIR